MSPHPAFEWELVTGNVRDEDVRVALHPKSAPDRIAAIHVLAGVEVFTLTFGGHVSTDYAHDDVDRPRTLRERIELAVAATTGPTRVTLERAGLALVGSWMVVEPDGTSTHQDTNVSWPIRRLKAPLRGRRIVREVVDFPEVTRV